MFVDVALPLPLPQLFTYRCPTPLQAHIQVGKRVMVPFINKKITGYVVKINDRCDLDKVRDVVDVLDAEPVLDTHMLELTRWISRYYLCAWGEATRNALPGELFLSSKQVLHYHPPDNPLLEATIDTNHPRGRMIEIIQQSQRITVEGLKRRMGRTPDFTALLNQLLESGEVSIAIESPETKLPIQHEKTIELTLDPVEAADKVDEFARRAPKRSACIEYLLARNRPVALSELREAGYSTQIARWLVENGLAVYGQREVFRDPLQDEESDYAVAEHLSAEQRTAFQPIQAALDQNQYRTFLLHGVTGSGKTRLYLEACQYVVRRGQQALVLVPEIALTPQMVHRFQAVFKDRVGLWHSNLSDGERFDIWRRARSGDYDVMIGTRSAIFSPLSNLRLIIVDEEHETSFKQDTTPRYHGRDVAVMRARMLNAVCILGSATPSLETYHNARLGRYQLLELPSRIAARPLPQVTVVDMRSQLISGRISKVLAQKVEERLAVREGIILFLNRRGYSTFVLCQDCGYVFECVNCHVTLTYHAAASQVKCHYCNYTKPAPRRCSHCGGFHLNFRGTGTQRIEDEVQRAFPAARILRLDVDTTRGRGSHRKILDQFKNGLADILLGTQMVAKGLDFAHVTLVGVVSADISLNLPDFRAAERTFQLLTQVAGRAGRGDKRGEVLVQTYAPQHYAILTARNHDYVSFYNREIRERQELAYPPFTRIINILISATNESQVITVAEELNQAIRSIAHPSISDVLGPAPAPISKIKGKYRWQIMIKSDNNTELRRQIYETIYPINATYDYVAVTINVDPMGL